ncbi:MAG TPA: hypothetical protein VMR41_02735 [Patescibacteria group bacterium]|nr:hypothetical protein [Patescibacteria group bacterium]
MIGQEANIKEVSKFKLQAPMKHQCSKLQLIDNLILEHLLEFGV